MVTILRFPAERVQAPPLVPDDWPEDWPDHGSPAPSFDALPPPSGTRGRRR
jgi:hypothetical protein